MSVRETKCLCTSLESQICSAKDERNQRLLTDVLNLCLITAVSLAYQLCEILENESVYSLENLQLKVNS